jgi:probable HAF family extracellular repeat protein
MNDNGQVVGEALTASGKDHAFLYSGGVMKDLGTLYGIGSAACGINNSGQVVGLVFTSPNIFHAFLYSDGAMKDLGTLGGTYSDAYGINASGQVVGSANTTSDKHQDAYLYSGGIMHDLGTLGGTTSNVNDINDSGQVVGTSTNTSRQYHAFLYDSGSMKDLGTLGGTYSTAYGINANGQIVGTAYTTSGATHAFLITPQNGIWYQDNNLDGINDLMQDLGTLDGTTSVAYDSNDSGQVVGYVYPSSGTKHAFLYSGGVMTDLNTLIDPGSGWVLYEAGVINHSGQIAGNGYINGKSHAFLLTPVPEPSTLAILGSALLGLSGILLAHRRRA